MREQPVSFAPATTSMSGFMSGDRSTRSARSGLSWSARDRQVGVVFRDFGELVVGDRPGSADGPELSAVVGVAGVVVEVSAWPARFRQCWEGTDGQVGSGFRGFGEVAI